MVCHLYRIHGECCEEFVGTMFDFNSDEQVINYIRFSHLCGKFTWRWFK